MDESEVLARLMAFGAPFFVPEGEWRVAGVEWTDDVTDGVLVFNHDGSVEVRTEALSRPSTPISVQVRNVQAATINAPDRERVDTVIVEEVWRSVPIDRDVIDVCVLESDAVFAFTVERAGRRVRVAGERAAFDSVHLFRQNPGAI